MMAVAKSTPKQGRKGKVKEVNKWLRETKEQSWNKLLDEKAGNGQYFKLVKSLVRKGKLNPKSEALKELKSKLPQVEVSLQ